MQLPKNTLDIGHKDRLDGKYHASYAEAKLMALYIDFHTKKPEALQYLASVIHWNSRILDVDHCLSSATRCLSSAA